MPQLQVPALHRLPVEDGQEMTDGYTAQREALRDRFGTAALISLNDAAAYLGVDRRTLLKDRSFPVRKVGTQYRVPLVGLARWLDV